MKDGFQVTVSLSEFTMAALLIAVVACAVAYSRRAPASTVIKEPPVTVTPTFNVRVPTPRIVVRVVLPKPDPVPHTDMEIEPEPPQQPKVWDNDNIPKASDPPTFAETER